MLRNILRYILFFGLLFLIAYNAHRVVLSSMGATLSFSLLSIYIFHALFSLAICILLSLFSKLPKLASQLGFLYLAGFLLKLFAFAAAFRPVIMGENALSVVESVSLLVPVASFLAFEVYFIAKLLRVMDAE